MSFFLSTIIATLCCMATGVSIEYRFIAMAIVFAGGLAGLGSELGGKK